MVRVLPDVSGIDRQFDYLVPPELAADVAVGTSVRVPLGARSVAGWVVDDDVAPPPGVRLLPLKAVRGRGPEPALVELARWAAWRWAGPLRPFLRAASPRKVVDRLPPPGRSSPRPPTAGPTAGATGAAASVRGMAEEALAAGRAVTRVPPAGPLWPVIEAVCDRLEGRGSVLLLCPATDVAARVADRLARAGRPVALVPDGWAEAAAGGRIVVGARAAAWAPAPGLAAVCVVDGHDESYRDERAPTWSAWEVAAERARRAEVPCVITSACPPLELAEWAPVLGPDRGTERSGWPVLEVVDRTGDDPRSGLFSERLVRLARSVERSEARPVVFVLNRKGRASLLACRSCGVLARCEACGGAVIQPRGSADLHCPRCGLTRPVVCAGCGGTRLALARPGVSRVAEEVSALLGAPVAEVSSDVKEGPPPGGEVVVGTEAALHRVRRASAVIFVEFDQELLAPRSRAAEQALVLIARAGRMVGGRAAASPGGRVMVQTRLPDHEVLEAAVAGDPDRLTSVEGRRRRLLRLPPYSALAELSGEGSEAVAHALSALEGVEVVEARPGVWWVRAADHGRLGDALASVREEGGPRVAVDPWRV